jgi:tripartite-type tricarboxylate transporter receptor subunit TctC
MQRINGALRRGAFAFGFALFVAAPGHAQVTGKSESRTGGFPAKAVRIIVGNAPGGANDIMGRLIAQRLNDAWGQPVIVENRSGGSGVIAMELAADANADGYTLLLSNSQMPTNMLLKKVKFDIRKAYAPVVQIAMQPYLVAVNPKLPVNSVQELIAYAKAKPGAISYGSPGVASPAHLGIELFKVMTGTDMVHVPYKGNGPAMVDLMSGQIQLLFGSAVSVAPQARSGKLKALAVTAPQRTQAMPDLPTVAESGVPGYELTNAYGLLAPAGTPPTVIALINRQCNAITQAKDFRARLQNDGVEAAAPNTPAQYAQAIGRDITRLEKFFKTPGVSIDKFR